MILNPYSLDSSVLAFSMKEVDEIYFEKKIRWRIKMAGEKKKLITQADIMKMLDACYDKSLHGINKISPPIEQFAEDYFKEGKR